MAPGSKFFRLHVSHFSPGQHDAELALEILALEIVYNEIFNYLYVLGLRRQDLMGSHHRQVAILVPDDKLDCFVFNGNFVAFDKAVKLFIRDQCCCQGLMAPHCKSSCLRRKMTHFFNYNSSHD